MIMLTVENEFRSKIIKYSEQYSQCTVPLLALLGNYLLIYFARAVTVDNVYLSRDKKKKNIATKMSKY